MTLPDDTRRDLCRMELEAETYRIPEYARQQYAEEWSAQLERLLALDINAAERYVDSIRNSVPALAKRLERRDPARQRAARAGLGVVISVMLPLVLVALAGQLLVAQETARMPAELHTAAVLRAADLTRRVWESSMPVLLLALAALVWVNPARHLLILSVGLVIVLAVVGVALSLSVPIWALVVSGGLVIVRAFRARC